MERIDPDKVSPLLRVEHWHRYLWAASLSRGRVLDAACGVGYGSAAILASERVTEYAGLDLSPEAVAHAGARYSDPRARFLVGDVTAVPLPDGSVDTIVSLETIEHLAEPGKALDEFRRVLAPGGVLLASVPSEAFERACEDTYGPNEFHKSRFTLERIEELLAERFRCVRTWECGLTITSVLHPGGEGSSDDGPAVGLEAGARWPHMSAGKSGPGPMGSYLFLACDDAALVERESAAREWRTVRLLPAVSVVEHDAVGLKQLRLENEGQAKLVRERGALMRKQDERIQELKDAYDKAAAAGAERQERCLKLESMVRDRDAAIRGQDALIQERIALIKKQDELVLARDATITELRASVASLQAGLKAAAERERAHAEAAKERAAAIGRIEKSIAERDEVIRSQAKLVDDRDAAIKRLEAMVRDRDGAIKSQTRLIDERVAYIRKLEGMVGERDQVIAAQAKLVEERDRLIRDQVRTVEELGTTARSLEAVLADTRAALTARREEIASLEARIAELEQTVRAVEAERADELRRLANPRYCVKITARALVKGRKEAHA